MNITSQLPFLEQKQDISFSLWIENLPQHQLGVTAFAVEEAIFDMTRIEIMLASSETDIDLRAIMDMKATLTVCHKYLSTLRHFSGIIVEAECGNEGHHLTAYRLVLMPLLYRLDHGSDCRIFQSISVPDIVKTILSEQGIEDVIWQVSEKHLPREYCVQYRESHLVFIRRIMAEEGIFYYFDHGKEGRETLVICDESQLFSDCPGDSVIEYNSMASGAVKDVYCSSLTFREKLSSTSFTQRDYTFKNPAHIQEHRDHSAHTGGEKNDYELYDYPGRYKQDETGKPFTRNKLEATRADSALAFGIANAPCLVTGCGFHLIHHPRKILNDRWRLLTIRHEGVQPQAFGKDAMGSHTAGRTTMPPVPAAFSTSGLHFDRATTPRPCLTARLMQDRRVFSAAVSAKGEENRANDAAQYACAFSAMPASTPYRPPQLKKPLIDGPQIAHVVGPQGEEIHTDEHGRVKIHFPWDRHRKAGAEDASCWIRVASGWAGTQWGAVSIPRIGHEVIVNFLEGDPDQPIVTGRTYHAVNRSPYQLPEHKTKMVIRSDTYKGEGFNEISLEDQTGRENMFIHAQKDQTVKILNNRAKRVEANEVESVGANHSFEVARNAQERIGGSFNRFVGGAGASLVASFQPLLAQGAKDMQSGSQAVGLPALTRFAETFVTTAMTGEESSLSANSAFSMAGDHFRNGGHSMADTGARLGGLLSDIMPMSGVASTVIEKFQIDTVGVARSEQIGAYKNTTVGHTMTINVEEELIIRVGESLFLMDKSGNITMNGTKFTFTATGPVQINGKIIDFN